MASKAPVRRIDPAKRDRTQAPPKPMIRDNDDVVNTLKSPKTDSARQRNHRFDGKAHGAPFADQTGSANSGDNKPNVSKPTENRPAYNKPNENRPLRSELRAETPNDFKRSDSKNTDFKNTDSKPIDSMV